MSAKKLEIIGNNTLIKVAEVEQVPAKIDTGADSSAIWASDINLNSQNQLEFCLFGPESPLYTGEKMVFNEYSVRRVRSSNGAVSVRFRVAIPTEIQGIKIRVRYTLADRSANQFPVLIGRKTLQDKFLVDVSQAELDRPTTMDQSSINKELSANPQKFFQKYIQKKDWLTL